MQDTDVQQDFDQLVVTAEAWLLSPAYSKAERCLELVLEEARRRDEDFVDAALEVAWNKLAGDLEWNTP